MSLEDCLMLLKLSLFIFVIAVLGLTSDSVSYAETACGETFECNPYAFEGHYYLKKPSLKEISLNPEDNNPQALKLHEKLAANFYEYNRDANSRNEEKFEMNVVAKFIDIPSAEENSKYMIARISGFGFCPQAGGGCSTSIYKQNGGEWKEIAYFESDRVFIDEDLGDKEFADIISQGGEYPVNIRRWIDGKYKQIVLWGKECTKDFFGRDVKDSNIALPIEWRIYTQGGFYETLWEAYPMKERSLWRWGVENGFEKGEPLNVAHYDLDMDGVEESIVFHSYEESMYNEDSEGDPFIVFKRDYFSGELTKIAELKGFGLMAAQSVTDGYRDILLFSDYKTVRSEYVLYKWNNEERAYLPANTGTLDYIDEEQGN